MPFELVHPSDKLTFAFDWSAWLAEGDTIASRIWTIDPAEDGASPSGIVLTNATTATVTVAGLEAGIVYRLTEKVTTTAGLIGNRSISIRCDFQ